MALCVYHETTQATAVCVVCKQDICAKCAEYGADGMCGMCLEMANARKASLEAARQARTDAPAKAGAGERPARPAGARPEKPAGARPAPAGAKGAPAKGAPATAKAPARPKMVKPGMCPEHPEKAASATCTNCERKVCPYCLDLYDLCSECRNLPHCSRHESMVANEKCAACKLPYCKVCLNGTDRCDRCRTLGRTAADGGKARTPTQPLRQQAKGTGKLEAPPTGPGSQDGEKGAPRPGPNRPKHVVKRSSAAYKAPKDKSPVPLFMGIGAVLLVVAGLFVFGGNHPATLTPEQQTKALHDDMLYVQKAVVALHTRDGRYPDSEEAIRKAIEEQGVKLEKLPVPLKLFINSPPNEALGISYRLVGVGYEIRALDGDGRPFAESGKDVVLTEKNSDTP